MRRDTEGIQLMDFFPTVRKRSKGWIVLVAPAVIFIFWAITRQQSSQYADTHLGGEISTSPKQVLTHPNISAMPVFESDGLPPDANALLSPQIIVKAGAALSRVFSTSNLHSWCINTKEGGKSQGLLYRKVPKSASSTLAGVVNRISRNHGGCDFHGEHMPPAAAGRAYGNRDRRTSFLFGSIRDPASRAVSRVFFNRVSRRRREPTDQMVLKWLNSTNNQFGTVSEGQGGFQLQYLSLRPISRWSAFQWHNKTTGEVKDPQQVKQNVQKVIEDYDFMAVVERMDESLVVLQMLLGVDVGDILILDSKLQGSYTHYMGKCQQNAKSHTSPRVKEYLASDVWRAQNYGDYLLHAAASESLDRTIEALGRDRVEEGLLEYRKLKAKANETCYSKAIFPCSKDGIQQLDKTNCYKKDWGCGYPCIDEMLSSMKAEN